MGIISGLILGTVIGYFGKDLITVGATKLAAWLTDKFKKQ